ncbi:MAG: hypothetical protein AAGI34_03610 [Pseudomonadota bacterium]
MSKSSDPFAAFAGPGTEAFKLWISFFPVAPAFGVRWVFADSLATMSPLQGMPTGFAKTTPPEAKAVKPKVAKPKAAKPKVVEPEVVEPVMPVAAPVVSLHPVAEEASTPPAPAVPPAAPKVVPAETLSDVEEPPLPPTPDGLMEQAPNTPDDLKMIKGIGPGLESKLNGLGVYTFEQIAKFSDNDLVWIDENLTAFKGRCFRDDWVGQAQGLLG